ncbi:MAG: YraN family protein [Butyricicoccus sp.]
MKGAWGEKAARLYLEKRGWHTAATNFRTRFGEIDIIAENAQYVIFAEVKTRKNARYGPACEAVHRQQARCRCRRGCRSTRPKSSAV